jgi:hypothetical protein
MSHTTRRIIFILIPIAAFCIVLGIYSIIQYRHYSLQEAHNRYLQQEIFNIDSLPDARAALAAYKKLQPLLPEVQLRILQRQWPIALELLRNTQLARYNISLQNDVAAYSATLSSHLDDMTDRCNSVLAEGDSLRTDIQWQVHNVAGAAKLLTAFLMLENEQNAEKVQGVMREALADFKAAIEAVDKAAVPPLQRNIPRWNFELLNGEQYIKKFEVAQTDIEKNQALKENLETLIPEMGGYAPGEPVETKIKK